MSLKVGASPFMSLSKTFEIAINIRMATARLTDMILGNHENGPTETLSTIASEIGLSNIAHMRVSFDQRGDVCSVFPIVTYSRLWQQRYALKKYSCYDPVVSHGKKTDEPFDWADLPEGNPEAKAFLTDALNHNVGKNGLSVPLHGRRGVLSLVSFHSDCSVKEWEAYKSSNLNSLKLLAVLVDAVSHIRFKLPTPQVHLSNREEQCLLWAARGKTYQEIATIHGLAFGTVKTHLDTARHKLRCMNLTQAAAVAFATGVFPAEALI
jgi:DNA-binding CsgD family transcriptional regulator